MKRIYPLTLVVIALTTSSYGQSLNCADFKEGNFTLTDDVSGVTYIERKGDVQIERNEKIGSESRLRVTWLDDCTYTLSLIDRTAAENDPILNELILTVKIIETKENSYIQETSANISDMVLTGEMFRVD